MEDKRRRRIMVTAMLVVMSLTLVSGPPVGAQGQTGTPSPVVPTGLWPRAMAYDGKNTLWITEAFDDKVLRLDINTNKVAGETKVWTSTSDIAQKLLAEGLPSALAYDSINHNMWVANFGVGNIGGVTVVDDKGQVVPNGTITGLNRPIAVKFAAGAMWVLTQTNDQLTRYNSVTFQPLGGPAIVSSPNVTGSFPTAMEYNDRTSTMWVALGNEDKISIIDIKTMKPKQFVSVGGFPIALAFDGTDMWVSHYDFTVWRLDGATGEVREKLPLSAAIPAPGADAAQRFVNLAAGGGHLWVVSGQDASVTDWGIVSSPISKGPFGGVGAYAGAAIIAGDYLFVSNWIENTVTRFRMDKIGPKPTATITPTFTLTPTFTATPELCAGLMPPRLKVGDKGFDTPDDTTPVNIRTDHNTKGTVLAQLHAGDVFTVLEGPYCDPPKYVWWKIRDKNGVEGWIVESDKSQTKYQVAPGEK